MLWWAWGSPPGSSKAEPLYQCGSVPKCGSNAWAGLGKQFKPHQAFCQGRESRGCTLQLPALTLSLKTICSPDFFLQLVFSGVLQNISSYPLSLNICVWGSILKLLFRNSIHRRLHFLKINVARLGPWCLFLILPIAKHTQCCIYICQQTNHGLRVCSCQSSTTLPLFQKMTYFFPGYFLSIHLFISLQCKETGWLAFEEKYTIFRPDTSCQVR